MRDNNDTMIIRGGKENRQQKSINHALETIFDFLSVDDASSNITKVASNKNLV